MFKTLIATLVALAVPARGFAQGSAVATASAVEQVLASSGYTYSRDGRRDPFVSPVGRGTAPKQATTASGIPGLLVNEVIVKGVVRGNSGNLAIIQSPDHKTYIIRSGDRLADGSVKTITQGGVVFSQDVHDPLSLVKQRDVPKRVRAGDGRG